MFLCYFVENAWLRGHADKHGSDDVADMVEGDIDESVSERRLVSDIFRPSSGCSVENTCALSNQPREVQARVLLSKVGSGHHKALRSVCKRAHGSGFAQHKYRTLQGLWRCKPRVRAK